MDKQENGLPSFLCEIKGEKISIVHQVQEAKFTRWSKQSKIYKDWDMDKNFEKFVDRFYKKTKTNPPNLA